VTVVTVALAYNYSIPAFKTDSADDNHGAPSAISLDLSNGSDIAAAASADAAQRLPFEPRISRPRAIADSPDRAFGVAVDEFPWQDIIVAPGDSLSLIFGRHGLSKKDLHHMLDIGGAPKNLKKIKPGQLIRVRADADGHILALIHEIDYRRSLHIYELGDRYRAEVVDIEPNIEINTATAEIRQSLFLDGQKAGLSDKTIMEMSDIFGWDIDFVLDIRAGDSFSVIYEEIYKNGEKVKDGRILGAEFINQGRSLSAVLYTNGDGHEGYYSERGQAMRKAFLRTPLNFTRISSRFNLRRRHPVLNTIRAHKGVDYAAPHGTPIRATADGKITFAGNKGGYGRTAILQHGESFSTLYAHMSRFARGTRKGMSVRQGQTIGYVGKTGLATGPHLHYEFRVNEIHRNPLTVKLPKALPIEEKYMADFKAKAAPMLAQLKALTAGGDGAATLVAQLETDDLSAPE
jgi:murein DD-endopeptidase MepM/ murein hydrolase activator NlpD